MGPTPPSLVEAGPLALRDPPTASERVAALIRAHRREPPLSSTPMLPPITATTSDPLHHTTTLTPPATLAPGDMVTPDANQLFYPVKKALDLPYVVPEAHNHKLEPSPRMTRYMHAHKNMAEGMSDLFNIMTRNGVPHQASLNVMVDLYDGRHMWGFTEKDIKNMKAAKAREEREDDLNKPLQFFRECKENNEYFYWDVDADPKTGVIKNIFWSHASQRAEYKDFGDTITFDTTHKTNSKKMPLAMFVGANNNLKNVTFGQALIGDESIGSFKWLFETFKSCMGGQEPHVILTDEDPAMKVAIELVFFKSQHRNCRWHIIRPWEFELDQLYTEHKDKNLKERLESLINYPLGPTQFEVEWEKLVDECGIADHPAIRALWDKRERWIAAYFKGMYCGRMTSTQRSESQNRVLKDGYVSESTSLHMFARRMLDSLQHADHMDAGETHYAQIAKCRLRWCGLAKQNLMSSYAECTLDHIQEYKKQYNNSTAFVIRPDPDPQMRLFCMHIIRAFTHPQVRKIPEKYIRKRYTRSARQEVTWDRHDGVLIGPAASQEQTRMSSLLPKLMKLGRAGSRSDRASQETNRQLDKIIPGIEMFPRRMENGSPGSGLSATESVATTAHPANDDTTANGSLGSGPSALDQW
ncbi:protein FAR1-RELATED SEQUENCE 5-like [Miscanthus floridulus]|uniref:protein FAR1-RELATED SEQUENCE 5-like n=1 Tax=Miscanthus floridulus TaxID=154761 RepID=UPI003459DF36